MARFNATVASIPKDTTGKSKYFEGLPIPSTLVLVGVLSYLTQKGWIEGKHGVPFGTIALWPDTGEIHVIVIVFGVWAAMMVSKTLKVPKL